MAATDVMASNGGPAGATGNDPLAPPVASVKGKLADPMGALVRARWNAGSDELMKQRRDHWQNLSMFFGEQWVWWDSRRNMLQALPQAWSPLGKGRARTVANLLRPNILSLLGRMMRNDLEFDVPPTDSADDVVAGAMLAEDVLHAVSADEDWRQVRYGENFAKFLGGTAAVSVEWDKSAGIPLGISTDSQKIVGTGQAKLCAHNINEFCIEPGAIDERQARWWISGQAMSPAIAQSEYDLDWLPAADASTMMSPLQQRLLEHMGHGQGTGRLTLVLTMYERPNPKCKAGRYVVVINGRAVAEEDWPFPDREHLNLFLFHQQQIEGTWIGTTLMNDAVPVQVQYNFMRSCIAEHAKKVGNARLMAAQGSFLEEDMSDDPGSILFYTPDVGGSIPQYLRPPDLPRWMVGEAGALKAELEDIMFVHATTKGEASFDRASGQALALLAEKDDSPLGLMAFEEAQKWSGIGTFVLKLYEANVSETRKINVAPRAGVVGEVRANRWNGKALKGQTRVHVPLETALPVSQAAQQAFARDMWDRGIIKDPASFARLLRLPQREVASIIDADVAKAQRENSRMLQGEAPEPAMFDDHGKHIAEHNRFRKSDSYLYADEQMKLVVDLHIKYHEQLAGEVLGHQTQLASINPALAAMPQADEPPGSAVPPDFAEQQAGMGVPPGGMAGPNGPPPPMGGPPPQPGQNAPQGQPPGPQQGVPQGPAIAAGANVPQGG